MPMPDMFLPMRVFFLVAVFWTAVGQECSSDGKLCDKHERCAAWVEEGHCLKNHAYMREHCPVSCANVPQPTKGECKDLHKLCPEWAKRAECYENPGPMRKYCPESCGHCAEQAKTEDEAKVSSAAAVADDSCVDSHDKCPLWALKGECVNNPTYMHKNCRLSCGTCLKPVERDLSNSEEANELILATTNFGNKQIASGDERARTLTVIEESVSYMKNEIDDLPANIVSQCLNRHDLCSFWAAIGECKANEGFMLTNCSPSCKSCHLIDMKARCPELKDAVPGLKPGSLNKMFERIISTAPGNSTSTLTDDKRKLLEEALVPEYTVTVHSRPEVSPDDETSKEMDKKFPPWVITFDNFITAEECQTLIDLGHKNGYERSKDVGKQKFDGSHDGQESQGRTSENAWCSAKSGCRPHKTVQRVMNRMSYVLDIPAGNSEDLQLLKYEKGQFYRAHHDYIPFQKDRQCGPRILTFFLYLSDVEEGGGTNFPNLDITVTPKMGRAVLWPSILNSDPTSEDSRTRHEALPVESGVKFAANGWYHLYDYVGPQSRGCS